MVINRSYNPTCVTLYPSGGTPGGWVPQRRNARRGPASSPLILTLKPILWVLHSDQDSRFGLVAALDSGRTALRSGARLAVYRRCWRGLRLGGFADAVARVAERDALPCPAPACDPESAQLFQRVGATGGTGPGKAGQLGRQRQRLCEALWRVQKLPWVGPGTRVWVSEAAQRSPFTTPDH
jgi:hypothetical protein